MLVQAFGWRSIFLINVPIGIAALVLAIILLPPSTKKITIGAVDFKGAGLLFAAFAAFLFGITQLNGGLSETSWVHVGVPIALSVGLIALFVRRERRVKEPIVELELLKRKPFLAANGYNLLYGMCALGAFTLVPLYAVNVYNMSAFESGVLLTPRSIGMMVASIIASFSLVKWGYRRPLLIGTMTVAVSFVLLALQPTAVDFLGFHLGTTVLLFLIVGLSGVGHGTCTPAANNSCIELMPDKVATITGLLGTFRNLGSAIGIAVSTLIISAVPDTHQAFFIVFLAPALLMLLVIPTIFMMPARPIAGNAPRLGKTIVQTAAPVRH